MPLSRIRPVSRLLRRAPAVVAALALAVVLAGCTEDLRAGRRPGPGRRRRGARARRLPGPHARRHRPAEQRHQGRRLHRGAHRRDLRRRRRCPRSSRTRRTTPTSSARSRIETCSTKFTKFLGADESLAMRTVLTGRGSGPRRTRGTRAPGGTAATSSAAATRPRSYVDLPADRQGPAAAARRPVAGLRRRPDRRRVGEDPVLGAHDWRAVSTIKLGEPEDPYPGDRRRPR